MNLKKKNVRNTRDMKTLKSQLNPIERLFIFGLIICNMLLVSFVLNRLIPVEKPQRPLVVLDVNTSRIYYAVDIRFTANDMMDFYDKRTGEHITLEYIGK